MQNYSLDSRLLDLLRNPYANDLVHDYMMDKGIPDTVLHRERLQKLTLGQIKRLSTPIYDDGISEDKFDIINAYDEQMLEVTDCKTAEKWWKEAVIYRVVAVGSDEIMGNVPYLKSMSINTVWADLNPSEETINDMLRMLHDNGLKLILDAKTPQDVTAILNKGVDGVVVTPQDNGEIHESLRDFNENGFGLFNGVVGIGFVPNVGLERAKLMTSSSRGELDMVFGHMGNPEKTYSLYRVKRYMLRWQSMPNCCWGGLSFDIGIRMLHRLQPRWLYKERVAELLCVLMMTLRGTPIIKQGQEIGLSTENVTAVNDEIEFGTPECYRRLIELRRANMALVYGDFLPVFTRDKDCFSYFRQYKDERFFVECNLTEHAVKRRGEIMRMAPLYCSYGDFTSVLRPYEANIYRVTG